MEAVQAAKEQGLAASEALDVGLRRAFWGESRCVSLRHVILEVASETRWPGPRAAWREAMDSGRARRALFDAVGDRQDRRRPGLAASLRGRRHQRRRIRGWRSTGTRGADGVWLPTIVTDDGLRLYDDYLGAPRAEPMRAISRHRAARRFIGCEPATVPGAGGRRTPRSCIGSWWRRSVRTSPRIACRRPSSRRCAPIRACATGRTCVPGCTPSPTARRPMRFGAWPVARPAIGLDGAARRPRAQPAGPRAPR